MKRRIGHSPWQQFVFLFFLFCLPILSVSSQAQQQAQIVGKVLDNFGKPLASVRIKIPGSAYTANTNSNGEYTISFAPGSFQLRFEKEGYWPASLSLNIATAVKFPAETVVLALVPPQGVVSVVGDQGYIPLPRCRVSEQDKAASVWDRIDQLASRSAKRSWLVHGQPVQFDLGLIHFADHTPEPMRLYRVTRGGIEGDPVSFKEVWTNVDPIKSRGQPVFSFASVELQLGLYAYVEVVPVLQSDYMLHPSHWGAVIPRVGDRNCFLLQVGGQLAPAGPAPAAPNGETTNAPRASPSVSAATVGLEALVANEPDRAHFQAVSGEFPMPMSQVYFAARNHLSQYKPGLVQDDPQRVLIAEETGRTALSLSKNRYYVVLSQADAQRTRVDAQAFAYYDMGQGWKPRLRTEKISADLLDGIRRQSVSELLQSEGSLNTFVSRVSTLLRMPVRGDGWYVIKDSPLHAPGKGYNQADDTHAIDLNWGQTPEADSGKPVYPAYPGKVVEVNREYGFVLLEHEEGFWYSGYMHMGGISVSKNQDIDVDTQLGSISNIMPKKLGTTTPHLHFGAYVGLNKKGGLRSFSVPIPSSNAISTSATQSAIQSPEVVRQDSPAGVWYDLKLSSDHQGLLELFGPQYGQMPSWGNQSVSTASYVLGLMQKGAVQFPFSAWGDFNLDGRTDIAFLLQKGSKQTLVVFVAAPSVPPSFMPPKAYPVEYIDWITLEPPRRPQPGEDPSLSQRPKVVFASYGKCSGSLIWMGTDFQFKPCLGD